MAKAIKFNLVCDKKPVRNIEDLQNNFSVEDVLEYHNNGLLNRWLEVRNYKEELEKVKAIKSENNIEIIKELIRIFNIEQDEKKIEESIYILDFLEKKKELYSIYKQEKYNVKRIIDDYAAGYRSLVNEICNNPNDIAKIKACIEEIVSNYEWALELDHRNLFYSLMNEHVLAVMCLLMNEVSRKYYLPTQTKSEDGSIVDEYESKDKDDMYGEICAMISSESFADQVSGYLITFAGITDGYWKDLEPKGKKYMIISMDNGDYVRAAGVSGGDLSCTDVRNKFVIVDGIDYKSNYGTHELCYMEV